LRLCIAGQLGYEFTVEREFKPEPHLLKFVVRNLVALDIGRTEIADSARQPGPKGQRDHP
jgi:hypothetical protein